LVAGTLIHSLDISMAITQCRKLVDNDSDVVVDTILTALKELGPW